MRKILHTTSNNVSYKCHICGNRSFNYKFTGFDYSLNKNNIKYKIYECKNCSLELIYPIPSKKDQISFYPPNYYSKHLSENKNSIKDKCFKMESILFSIFNKKELILPNYDGQNAKTFLDIGCGDGKNLSVMKLRNWNVKGFEIDNSKYVKDDIYYGESITEIDFGEKFDVIWCSHVFEHVDNPREFLVKIKNIMKDNGQLILNLPNVKGLSGYVFGKYAVERDIPRHLFGYSYKNIQKLFNALGFKIVYKHRGRQSGTVTSFVWSIIGKFNVDVRKYQFLYIFLGLIFIPIDFILSLIGFTNSMGFVLMKK